MTKKLVGMESRLEGATQRVVMLSTLLEQKEVSVICKFTCQLQVFKAYFGVLVVMFPSQVQLRNSEAALAAERRLFWLRQQHQQEQRSSRETLTGGGGVSESKTMGRGQEGILESDCDDEVSRRDDHSAFLSDVWISAEVLYYTPQSVYKTQYIFFFMLHTNGIL